MFKHILICFHSFHYAIIESISYFHIVRGPLGPRARTLAQKKRMNAHMEITIYVQWFSIEIPMPSANTATALAPHHTNTNTIQHHTNTTHWNSQKKSTKIRFGTTPKQPKIEENHVLWYPWAIPGHSWVLLGRPRGSKGEKVTKNVVRSPPSRDLFGELFCQQMLFFTKMCAPGACFLQIVFLSICCPIFGWFSTPWNHKNTNFSWEWHRNQENHKTASWASPGAVLGRILAQFWTPLGSFVATLAENCVPENVPKKNWKKITQET